MSHAEGPDPAPADRAVDSAAGRAADHDAVAVEGAGVVVGLLLAAGAGRRLGQPKALVPGWVADRCAALSAGGCDAVVVVLGAAADEARAHVPVGVDVVVAEDWPEGQSASLRAGLGAARLTTADAVAVALVDTPGLTAAAVARTLAVAREGGRAGTAHALVRATYDGEPGHPVVLGRAHWPAVVAEVTGDRGARDLLARAEVRQVPCEDVGEGHDVDLPDTLSDEDDARPRGAGAAHGTGGTYPGYSDRSARAEARRSAPEEDA